MSVFVAIHLMEQVHCYVFCAIRLLEYTHVCVLCALNRMAYKHCCATWLIEYKHVCVFFCTEQSILWATRMFTYSVAVNLTK